MSIPPRFSPRAERRVHPRLDVDSPAVLSSGAIVFDGRIENIGTQGASFITRRMEPELACGSRAVIVAPDAEGEEPVPELRGVVIRTDVFCDGSGDSRVIAVRFDQPFDG